MGEALCLTSGGRAWDWPRGALVETDREPEITTVAASVFRECIIEMH